MRRRTLYALSVVVTGAVIATYFYIRDYALEQLLRHIELRLETVSNYPYCDEVVIEYANVNPYSAFNEGYRFGLTRQGGQDGPRTVLYDERFDVQLDEVRLTAEEVDQLNDDFLAFRERPVGKAPTADRHFTVTWLNHGEVIRQEKYYTDNTGDNYAASSWSVFGKRFKNSYYTQNKSRIEITDLCRMDEATAPVTTIVKDMRLHDLRFACTFGYRIRLAEGERRYRNRIMIVNGNNAGIVHQPFSRVPPNRNKYTYTSTPAFSSGNSIGMNLVIDHEVRVYSDEAATELARRLIYEQYRFQLPPYR